MRNQRGITLIALVITIIVLLILAGVSIAMLTGDNGILTQANNAKVSQIEGQVREEVNLAVQAAKMYAEQKAVETPNGYLAQDHLTTDIKDVMDDDLTSGKGYSIVGTNAVADPETAGKISITYTTPEYESATNKDGAKITVDITVENNTFTIGTYNYTQR